MKAVIAAGALSWSVGAVAQVAPTPPPYVGAYQPRGVDEIGLWREDDESERELAASPLVIRDEALTGYVRKVLCDTVGNDRCQSTRVYILREPSFNASMSYNGTMRVHSGLLLRVRNEAELGSILGHEFGHFERRHGLADYKTDRSNSDFMAWGALLASMAPGYKARSAYNDMRLSIYGRFYRYQRDQEREADLLGIGYLNRSTLRPQSAAIVWRNLMREAEASALSRGRKKPDFSAIAFTASHPPHAERAGYLSELADPTAGARDDGAARYGTALATWLPVFLDDQVKLNDFGGSEYLIEMLAENGWTAPLWFARGELYRARGAQRDLVNAGIFYGEALKLDANMADAYRGRGLSLLKTGDVASGRAALRSYLTLKPGASDAAMIAMLAPTETTP